MRSSLGNFSRDLLDESVKEQAVYLDHTITGETRRGFQINKNDKARFKPLSPGWISYKARIAKVNNLHKTYRRSLANDTMTGQLVNALWVQPITSKNRIIFRTRSKVLVAVADKPYRPVTMPPVKLPNKNKFRPPTAKQFAAFRRKQPRSTGELYESTQDQGRDFVEISRKMKDQMVVIIQRVSRRLLRAARLAK